MAQVNASGFEKVACLFPDDCCCARGERQSCGWATMVAHLSALGRPLRRPPAAPDILLRDPRATA